MCFVTAQRESLFEERLDEKVIFLRVTIFL